MKTGCDIIIPVWNQLETTKGCIENLIKNTHYPYRLILIDNASGDDTRRYLENIKNNKSIDMKFIRNETNLGFVKAANQGLRVSAAPYVCVLNNDTIPAPGWLENLIEFAERHPDIGLMNPQCNRRPGISLEEHAKDLEKNKDVYMEMNQCLGFCMLIKREVIEKIGYLDEGFGIGSYDDTDYSMRAGKAGYRCVCVYSSYVHHLYSVSFKAMGNKERLIAEGEKRYFKKWPRHLRIGMTFSIDKGTSDREIENLLKGTLSLAREWCWVNLWIFGDKNESMRIIESMKNRIGMPRCQNIKYNFFSGRFKAAQVMIRILERLFGTKRRKRYDTILLDDKRLSSLIAGSFAIHRMRPHLIDYTAEAAKHFGDITAAIRKNDE